jgi:hypothetical protein
VLRMSETIRILTVERDGDDGLIATFSDGTTAGYFVRRTAGVETAPRTDRSQRFKRERGAGVVSTTKLHGVGELMGGPALLILGALHGMEREAKCEILARKQPPNLGPGYIWASIVDAPADLPDGEYQVRFDQHMLRATKERDQWLSSGPIACVSA